MITLDKWQSEILEEKGNICLISGRQTGKSTIISILNGEFVINNPNKSVLIIAATERQANLIYSKVLNYIEFKAPRLIMKGRKRPTKNALCLHNGSIIRCLPCGQAGIGIRGFTIDLLIADEAAFIPNAVWAAVTPMLLVTAGRIILVSTPHGSAGYFYERTKDPAFKVFHVSTEEVVKNRPICATWTEEQRKGAIEHLERERLSMSKNEWLQEYGGIFIDDFNQFFSDELIQRCMTLKRPSILNHKNRFYLGIDVAQMGKDESAFAIMEKIDNEHLLQREQIITRKTRINETTDLILSLDIMYKFRNIYIDDAGLGVGVFDYLLINPLTKNKVIAINNRSRPLDKDEKYKKKLLKEDLYNNLLMLMEHGQIQFLDDDEIFLSLKSIQYEYISGSHKSTFLRIFGKYSHVTESLIRSAWSIRDKSLGVWCR